MDSRALSPAPSASEPPGIEGGAGVSAGSTAAGVARPPAAGPPAAMPPFDAVPPLAALTALAALADLFVVRLALPSLQPTLSHASLLELARWGSFATNLAAIAGLVALVSGLRGLVRSEVVHPRRSTSLVFFAVIFVSILTIAALFPPQRMNRQLVFFCVGAANVMIVTMLLVALRHATRWRTRFAALALAVAAAGALSAQLVELLVLAPPSSLTLRLFHGVRGLGEAGHLMGMMLVGVLLLPSMQERKGRLALMAGGSIAGITAVSLLLARVRFSADYPLILYHAQRLVLLLEHASWAYAIPLATALGTATAAFISPTNPRVQAGIGLLLLISAGYAPRAPGRLLMLTLAGALIARALLALSEHAHRAAAKPTPTANQQATAAPRAADAALPPGAEPPHR